MIVEITRSCILKHSFRMLSWNWKRINILNVNLIWKNGFRIIQVISEDQTNQKSRSKDFSFGLCLETVTILDSIRDSVN